jgi:hypothetical protein
MELPGHKLAENDIGGFGPSENPIAKDRSAFRNKGKFSWIAVVDV